MVKKMTPFNKALVQSWAQLATMDDEEALIRVMTQRQIGALVAMCEYLKWKTRYDGPPDQDVLDQFSAETEFNLTDPVQICALIIECIETDEDVKAALSQWFSNAVDNDIIVQQALQRAFDPGKGGSQIPEGYAGQNQYGSALGCDNDDGWGHIRGGLIERSFERVQNVLERIEAVTDNQEMLAEFLNAIPGVGAFFDVIPVTDWVLWFDNVRAWMKDQFEASDSTDLRDQIACDLFCIWQQNCSLSVEQIRSYYWSKTIEFVPTWDGAFDSLSELAIALGQLSTTNFGETIVYALVGSQYGFLTFVNDWFGIHINATANDLALGDPSDDWMALCDDCPSTWMHEWDLETSDYDFSLVGTWIDGVGVQSTGSGGTPYAAQVYLAVPDWAGATLTRWEVDATSTVADGGAFRGFYSPTDGGSQNFGGSATGDYTLGDTPLLSTPADFAIQISNATIPGTNTIRRVRLYGDGIDPFL